MSRETPDVREFAENCGFVLAVKGNHHRDPYGQIRPLPDFLNDLNACFEALEWFCDKQVLIWELGRAAHPPKYYCCFEVDCRASSHTADCRDDVETLNLTYAETKQAAIIRAVNAAAKARPR